MSRKYQPLIDYLNAVPGDEVTLSFEELEALVGPMRPYTRTNSFWANTSKFANRPAWLIQQRTEFESYFQRTAQKVCFRRRKP